jgi:hypothetical protein
MRPVYEIEDWTKRTCSWGDIWSDLYYEQEELAEMKYQAFMEECGLANNTDDYDESDEELPSSEDSEAPVCEAESESFSVCEEKKVTDEEPMEMEASSVAAEDEECADGEDKY